MTKAQIATVAEWKVPFALSPVNPKGFVKHCHKHGILAIPGTLFPGMRSMLFADSLDIRSRKPSRVLECAHEGRHLDQDLPLEPLDS